MRKYYWILLITLLAVAGCSKKEDQSALVVKAFVSYTYYWMELRDVQMQDEGSEGSLNEMEKNLTAIDLSKISNSEGKLLFEETRQRLLKVRGLKGFESGFKLAEASKGIGDIMKFYNITEDDVEPYNDSELVESMNAIKKLMQATGQW